MIDDRDDSINMTVYGVHDILCNEGFGNIICIEKL